MKVSIIGVGKLGLCFALTLEKAGYDILGCDIGENYVKSLNYKTFISDEPGVNKLLAESEKFSATTNLSEAVEHSNVLFLLVATPSLSNGEYDHSQIENVSDELIKLGRASSTKHLIVGCTTMPGYCDSVQKKLKNHNYTVSYNPEFIAQGTIINNQLNPDMVLIGEGSQAAGDIIESIYVKQTINEPKIHRMSRIEAEICKLSLNCFLTTKIAFANMVGDITLRAGGVPTKVLSAIGSDSRIGKKYLKYGYGYGGPCFPRDNRALAIYANTKDIEAVISKASDASNKLHLKYQLENFSGENPIGTKVRLGSVTYKPESTLLVESQQLLFAVELANQGYDITICERQEIINKVSEQYGKLFKYQVKEGIKYEDDFAD